MPTSRAAREQGQSTACSAGPTETGTSSEMTLEITRAAARADKWSDVHESSEGLGAALVADRLDVMAF